MATVSGRYVIKSAAGAFNITCGIVGEVALTFTSNGNTYSSISAVVVADDISGTTYYYLYYGDDVVYTADNKGGSTITDEAYLTIDITGEQTVDDTFYDSLSTYAMKYYPVSGKWKWIFDFAYDLPGLVGNSVKILDSIEFTSNGISLVGAYSIKTNDDGGGDVGGISSTSIQLVYYDSGNTSYYVYDYQSAGTTTSEGWSLDAYQTIEITGTQYISATQYDLLTAHLTQDFSSGSNYIGIGNVAKRISDIYVGVGGVAKKVVKAYIGVGGIAKQVFGEGSSAFTAAYLPSTVGSQSLTTISSAQVVYLNPVLDTSTGVFTAQVGGKTFSNYLDIGGLIETGTYFAYSQNATTWYMYGSAYSSNQYYTYSTMTAAAV